MTKGEFTRSIQFFCETVPSQLFLEKFRIFWKQICIDYWRDSETPPVQLPYIFCKLVFKPFQRVLFLMCKMHVCA